MNGRTSAMMCGMKVAQRRLTYPELRLLPDNGRGYELVDGEVYLGGEKIPLDTLLDGSELPVTPSPSEKHQRVSGHLFVSMYQHVKSNRLGSVYYAPFDVVFGEHTAFQPDIVFVSQARRGIVGPEYILGPPDLVVEIISPFRANYDRGRKFENYARHGVGEYWIIDPIAEIIEVFQLVKGQYELKGAHSEEQFLESPLLPGWKVAAHDLFVG